MIGAHPDRHIQTTAFPTRRSSELIKKADPPSKVVGAFQQVAVAQQEAERDRSEARAWAQQLLARAEGDAAAFDKVYQQYKLAPEVTKRRMRSDEHTSELQSLMRISYAVFCLTQTKTNYTQS